jgi:hypothetical protein
LIAGNADDFHSALANIRAISPAPIVCKRGAAGCHVYLEDMSAPITATITCEMSTQTVDIPSQECVQHVRHVIVPQEAGDSGEACRVSTPQTDPGSEDLESVGPVESPPGVRVREITVCQLKYRVKEVEEPALKQPDICQKYRDRGLYTWARSHGGRNPKTDPEAQAILQRERLSKLATWHKYRNWTHQHSQGQWGWTHLQVGRSVLYAFMDSLGHLPADIQILIYMYTLPPLAGSLLFF